ncbi:peptide-methionine (R)-S-oxide reductase MsrB [Candidatus Micrarchaeota archaeon]|nr:peptide-methionine (R)-S-oxide reductase MsrB [Candidatus Micrarchaeota archaeon]
MTNKPSDFAKTSSNADAMPKTDSQWQEKLTPEKYRVMRQKGTELPFTGKLLNNKESGKYICAGCGTVLFSSEAKFDSGSGWPSFYAANKDTILAKPDTSHGMTRVEVVCRKCGGHLGHVFDDGPGPDGKRYCINSVCLEFKKK